MPFLINSSFVLNWVLVIEKLSIFEDTNWPVQSQKIARSLKFWIEVEEELSSENKDADLSLSASLFLPMQIVGFPMRQLICHCN